MEWEEIAEARLGEIRRLRSVIRDFNSMLNRKNEMLFELIQHARKVAKPGFYDWKDADDWLFAQLDFTVDEVKEIFKDRGEMVYLQSCIGAEEHSEQSAEGEGASQNTQSL